MIFKNKKLYITISLYIIFILFTLLVKFVDREIITSSNLEVGFSSINKLFLSNYNALFDNLSDGFMFLAIFLLILLFLEGIRQYIVKSKLLKVDYNILLLPITLLILLFFYIIFNKIEINYRPIVFDNIPELSYPSSHVLLITTIILLFTCVLLNISKNKYEHLVIILISIFVICISILCRILSGVHYFTDIFGSLILSFAIFYTHLYLVEIFTNIVINKKRA